MTIRVLLADDQALLRQTFRMLLDSCPDIKVVGEAADGAHAVELTRAHRPDLVVMDIRMPGTDGLAAREREAVALAAHGLSNEEIAEQLFVSPYTARTHVHRAMAKLNARDRAQLVVIAYQSGLVAITHD